MTKRIVKNSVVTLITVLTITGGFIAVAPNAEGKTVATNQVVKQEKIIKSNNARESLKAKKKKNKNKSKKANYFDGVKLKYNKTYTVSSNPLTKTAGVTYFNNHKETYYSQRVLPGTALNIPGRHVAEDGTVRDKDGFIVVAADLSYKARGSKVMTSRGPGKVYDTGCAYGVIDIYVNW